MAFRAKVLSRLASTQAMPPRQPLIAVLGATGTGKSELAVEIASRFNGEIINGDAMQMYDGLPIITNKMPVHERKGIRHHLLGCIGVDEPPWTVAQFTQNANRIVDELNRRGKLPILVGGTHYYTQALLFNQAVLDGVEEDKDQSFEILERPTEEIYGELQKVDPLMAVRWHPHDRRKIQRSLEIYLRTGRRASDLYREQAAAQVSASIPTNSELTEDGSDRPDDTLTSGSLRWPTLIFWVYSERLALHRRLDARVLHMVDSGLLDEVASLESYVQQSQASGSAIELDKGIWVSIGYKEFAPYQNAARIIDPVDLHKNTESLASLKKIGVDATQAATRQYSNRQTRWIRIKLLNALERANATSNIFLLDSTNVASFKPSVIDPAIDIAQKFLQGEVLPDPREMSEAANEMLLAPSGNDLRQRPDLWVRNTCELCRVTTASASAWQTHLESGRHKKALSGQRRREQFAKHLSKTQGADFEGSAARDHDSPEGLDHGSQMKEEQHVDKLYHQEETRARTEESEHVVKQTTALPGQVEDVITQQNKPTEDVWTPTNEQSQLVVADGEVAGTWHPMTMSNGERRLRIMSTTHRDSLGRHAEPPSPPTSRKPSQSRQLAREDVPLESTSLDPSKPAIEGKNGLDDSRAPKASHFPPYRSLRLDSLHGNMDSPEP